jgi:hypothetical protein
MRLHAISLTIGNRDYRLKRQKEWFSSNRNILGAAMTRVEQLEQDIASLPANEYRQLRDWIIERDWAQWDKQIEADAASGKLDFLVEEALEEKRLGRTTPLNIESL